MIDGGSAIESAAVGAPLSSVPSHIGVGPALVLVIVLVVCPCASRAAKTMLKDTSRYEALPFPGEYGPTGFATQYITLECLTNVALSEHCKTFKLPHSGNKAALTQRPKDFSKDRQRWDRCALSFRVRPMLTKVHASLQRKKKAKPKVSTLRREGLFNGADGVRVANAPVTERSKDLRKMDEKAAIMPWAKRIVDKYPYQPITDLADANASIYISPEGPSLVPALQPQNSSTSIAPSPHNKNTIDLLTDFLAYVQRNGDSAVNASQPSPDSPVTAEAIPLPAPSSLPSPSDGGEPMSTADSSSAVDVTMSMTTSISSSIADSHDDDDTRTRIFSSSDVPDPPAVSYAKRIEDLLLEWDDNLPQWNGRSHLKIKSVPIPLKYWPMVYKYWKKTQWEGAKKVWFHWKIIFHAMSSTTLDDFWAKYSTTDNSGNIRRLMYTPLVKRPASERQAEIQRLADPALVELTPE
ncbi:hypothetical protein B0H13DRAFT_2332548 [Mycena leptocephala]|nr:hypothetical protein B0H13DRAFT_2332548 [Mycena leptocephala]